MKDRFLSHVRRNLRTGCWLWTGRCDKDGYGEFQVDGKKLRANRASYRLFVGEIPAGLWVLHSCDTPACVQPEHLYLGTAKQNSADRDGRGRAISGQARKTRCPQGHTYDEENTYHNPANGGRVCRICNNAGAREYRRRKSSQ